MTEVVSPAQQVISVRRYEAAPVKTNTELVDPDNLLATNKEEEWVTKKKTELTTTKQIETRVKRHVVLEDGKVVDDSGPIVTTNTTEDTEKQEHQHTEHRTHGDGDDPPSADEGWVAVPGPGGMVKEIKEKKVRSREEREERKETEDIHHLGDITDEGYLAAVRDNKDVRRALLSGQEVVRGDDGQLVVVDPRNSGPRLIHQSSKGRKVVDTENTHEISEVQPDGRVVTEKRRTTEHEEVDEKEDPDDGALEEEDKYRESSQRFRKSKDQELVEYLADGVKIGQEMRYQCENVEGERFGDPAALAAEDQQEWDSLSTRIRRMRRNKLQQRAAGQLGPAPGTPAAAAAAAAAADRKDALTRRPLDFDLEEETRKVETSKWLEHHFGSESRSSKDSIEDEDDVQRGTTTSFINVTMKSRPVAATTSSSRVFVSSPEPRPESPYFQEDEVGGYRGSALRKKDSFREWDRDLVDGPRAPSPSPSPPPMPANKKLYQRTRFAADIPPPSSRHHSSTTPPPPPHPPTSNGTTVVKTHQQSASQIIGDSFRKLVGKFRSASSERKPGKAVASRKLSNKSRGSSRSPSPRSSFRNSSTSPTYRAAEGSLLSGLSGFGRKKSKSGRRSAMDGDGSSPDAGTEEGDSPEEVPVAPPRHAAGSRAGVKRSQSRAHRSTNGGGEYLSDRDTVDGEARTTRKYYLGEDPFGGSIYGREREYDGVVPARRKQRDTRRGSQSEEERNSSLGRLSKSTSRLTGTAGTAGTAGTQHNTMLNGHSPARRQEYYSGRGGSQTLPRKLRDREEPARAKKQVYVTKSNVERSSPPQVWEHRFSRDRLTSSPRSSPLASPHTGSLINVSFVNQQQQQQRPHANGVTWDREAREARDVGPAKPARTYRTSLTRSKSFNVQAGPTTYVTPAKSSSQLHRLEESPPPLKSPSILASISRSTRDLTEAVDKENNHVEELYTKPQRRQQGDRRLFSSTSHLNGVNSQPNGGGSSGSDPKKKAFMRGLLDRAPELFKTLHPEEEGRSHTPERAPVRVIDYSNSFRSSNTATPPPRFRADRASPSGVLAGRRDSSGSRGSPDYSETVRITSKCTDPLRPSVTSTVQSFSKRTLPSRSVVETSDTSTVTKSGSRYRSGGGGGGGSGDSGVDTSSGSSPHSRFIMDASKYPRHSARHADKHALNGGVLIEVRNTRK